MACAIFACATFSLYFANLEAEALQRATSSVLVWPSIIGTMWRLRDTDVFELTQHFKVYR